MATDRETDQPKDPDPTRATTVADYFDGRTAGKQSVSVRLGASSLTLYDADGAPVVAWPLATIRRLPGARSTQDELRLIPDFESEERLVLRDPTTIAAVVKACGGLDAKRPAQAGMLRRVVVWFGVAIVSVLLILFVVAPMLSDTLAGMIPPEREIALGEKIADRIAESGIRIAGIDGGLCAQPEGLAALEILTDRIASVSDAHLPIVVRVLNDETVNAFALPGGQVLLLRGLIESAGSAEEIAGVLAHEIGHVISRDPTRNMLRSFASGVVVSTVLGDFMGGFIAVALASAVVDASYSREAEAAADQTALRLLAKAGVPARPLAGFFARIRAEYGDGGSYLDSHPTSASREQIFREAPTESAATRPVLSAQEWSALRNICQDADATE